MYDYPSKDSRQYRLDYSLLQKHSANVKQANFPLHEDPPIHRIQESRTCPTTGARVKFLNLPNPDQHALPSFPPLSKINNPNPATRLIDSLPNITANRLKRIHKRRPKPHPPLLQLPPHPRLALRVEQEPAHSPVSDRHGFARIVVERAGG